MTRIHVVDLVGGSGDALEQSLSKAGWTVYLSKTVPDRPSGADAVVLCTDEARLGESLGALLGQETPIILITRLDRSGWDRTAGGAADLFGVDALFDLPADMEAVAGRLKGILAARAAVKGPDASKMTAIIERAIANEEAAAAFYRQAAARVTDPVCREALEGLMRDEEEHKRLIEEFRRGERPLPAGEQVGGSLVESFGSPDFSADLTPADAFLLAARKEKMAVDFYENWARLYPEGAERELLTGLAEVERRHKTKVEALFTNASFPEAW